jgi:Domain of unknown function (DUF4384)
MRQEIMQKNCLAREPISFGAVALTGMTHRIQRGEQFMKQLLPLSCLLLALTVSGLAQGAKNMYDARLRLTQQRSSRQATQKPVGRPGSKIWVEIEKGRTMVPVTASFKSGQSIRLHLKINYEGFLTIFNIGSSGKLQLIYPRTPEQSQAPLPRTTDFVVPTQADRWLTLDQTKGTETLTVIMSAQPIPEVLQYVSQSTSTSGMKPDQAASDALDGQIQRKTQSKDFVETRLQQSDRQATYVVATSSAAALEKPVVFRVRMNHK